MGSILLDNLNFDSNESKGYVSGIAMADNTPIII